MQNYKRFIFILLVGLFLATPFFVLDVEARSGCCSHHGGVCGCRCCDGTSLSATCAPYYPSCNPTPIKIITPAEPVITTPTPEPEPVVQETTDPTTLNEALGTVIGITDGDTVTVDLAGVNYKIRLIGIDTPESVDPRKPVECFSKEATNKITSLIDGKKVVLKRDAINDNKDIYDRLLRYVYLDGVDINAEMIKQGYAYAYLKYSFEEDRMKLYKEHENTARGNELGLWAPGICGNSIDDKSADTHEGEVAGVTTSDQKLDSNKPIQPDLATGDQVGRQDQSQSNNQGESTSGDFDVGLITGIVLAMMGLGVWKIFKKRKTTNS